MTGFVYLLHFSAPISPRHTCQHYIGYTDDLPARIQAHRHGNAARLTEVAHQRGIKFDVVRVWRGTRATERRLKSRKATPGLCPICTRSPYAVRYAQELTSAEIHDALIPF